MTPEFLENGFAIYDHDPELLRWSKAALTLAEDAVQNHELRERWLVCEGTWLVGVDALPTGPAGEALDVPLQGRVIRDLDAYASCVPEMHKAQLSVVYPGYPKPREGESDAAFRYRQKRDAAHVDGLHAKGADRRRHLSEPHAYILGVPLTDCSQGASPTVVWTGSHKIMRDAFQEALGSASPEEWPDVDLTEVYQAARREVFESCERVELEAKPGQAIVIHRLALHGISPWRVGAVAPPEGRMIAFFRPELRGSFTGWLSQA